MGFEIYLTASSSTTNLLAFTNQAVVLFGYSGHSGVGATCTFTPIQGAMFIAVPVVVVAATVTILGRSSAARLLK